MSQRVEKIAKAARITLTPEEVKKFEKDFSEILKMFDILEEAKTEGVKPSFLPIEIKNTTRKDEVEPSLSQEEALAQTKQKEKGYFKGPAAV